jgi:hypothetical protein
MCLGANSTRGGKAKNWLNGVGFGILENGGIGFITATGNVT